MKESQIVEAILFASDAPLRPEEIARADDTLDEDVVEAALGFLRTLYEESERAFQVVELGEGFQILTRPEFAPYLERFDTVPRPSRLSHPALETLAIIAYRQPIGRIEVEYIRGVSSSGVIRTLQDRGLVEVVGRDEGLGRPLLYGTTQRFLEHFGFANLEALPRPDELPVILRDRESPIDPDDDDLEEPMDDPSPEIGDASIRSEPEFSDDPEPEAPLSEEAETGPEPTAGSREPSGRSSSWVSAAVMGSVLEPQSRADGVDAPPTDPPVEPIDEPTDDASVESSDAEVDPEPDVAPTGTASEPFPSWDDPFARTTEEIASTGPEGETARDPFPDDATPTLESWAETGPMDAEEPVREERGASAGSSAGSDAEQSERDATRESLESPPEAHPFDDESWSTGTRDTQDLGGPFSSPSDPTPADRTPAEPADSDEVAEVEESLSEELADRSSEGEDPHPFPEERSPPSGSHPFASEPDEKPDDEESGRHPFDHG